MLGHRAVRIRRPRPLWIYKKGFDIQALGWLALHTVAAKWKWWRFSPNWNANPSSDHAPWDGLWAVEPHLGLDDVGAKWEQLLLIQGRDVRWLDEDVPHVRWWRANGVSVAAG